jgi:lantibiotic biosynthesis protein
MSNHLLEKNKIDLRIIEIEKVIKKSSHLFQSISLQNGVLGFSLFYFYYYLYKKDEKYLNKAIAYLESIFTKISSNTIFDFDPIDFIELGRYLCFLHRKDILESVDLQDNITVLKSFVDILLEEKIKEKDLDSVGGIIGAGHFFLDAYGTIPSYKSDLEKIILVIEKLSIDEDADSIYWYFPMRNKNEPIVELGFFHGVSGVIFFLLRAYKSCILTEKCHELIVKASSFLIKQKSEKGVNLFPVNLNKHYFLQYQNINYGDVSIGYVLHEVGVQLEIQQYKKLGIETLLNATCFLDDDNVFIKDAELAYGSAGLFSLFSFLEYKIPQKQLKKAENYWLNKTLCFNNNNTVWAGYDTYFNGFNDFIQVSFGHGIAGIGISLINHQLSSKHEYLTLFNYE